MADEENPFGGGPFGVGPFGPLVGAAAAVAAFSMVTVTIAHPVTRTLFYQAKIAPPPQAPAAAAEINAAATVTTGAVRSKSLFYQARIQPPVQLAVDNTGTVPTWFVQLSRAPPRLVAKTTLYSPFVPQIAPQPTADEWLQPWKRQVAVPLPVHTQPTFAYQPVAVVADVTADQWLPRWRGPPSNLAAPAGGSPFVPKEAVLENTQTPDKWLPRWQGPPSYHPAPAGGSPFVPKEAVRENTVTPDAWMPRWQGPPRYLQALAGGITYPWQAAAAVNTRTEWDWTIAWQGPPRRLLGLPGGAPFVPKEAVLENTQTPDKWLKPLGTVPPRYVPPKVLAQPFVPKEATSENTVTPDKWLIKWQGPPRYLIELPGGSPFIAKEAVLENTVTPDKWLVRFAKAVPTPKPVPTQPEYRYPYETQAIVVPYEQWWHQPLSTAAALSKRPVHNRQFQPFIPKEATRENTLTGIGWHRDLNRPVAKRPVTPTQPAFVYSPPAVVTLTTTLEWQQPLSRAVPGAKARPTQPVYAHIVPPTVAADEINAGVSVTTALRLRKTLFYQAKIQAPYPYAPAVVDNTVTIDKWQQPFGRKAAPRSLVHPGLWTFGYPYEGVACIRAFQSQGGYQFDAFQTCADEQGPVVGPADEPERVICIPRQSRVAVVPEVLRSVTVLVSSRTATVPEESRTVEALFSDRGEESNLFTTLPCAAPIVMPEPEAGHAFQPDAFQDDAFE